MSTKQKILDKSKEIFNAKGIQTTTLRQIALALDMSQGNLNYHFKTKQDIIDDLYFALVDQINAEMAKMTQDFSLLSTLYRTAEKSMYVFYEYRFFLRDLYLIFRESVKIKEHYLNLQNLRKVQFENLFATMIEKEVIRKEEFPNEYERLYERMTIIGDNWINAAELFKEKGEHPPVKHYQDLLFEMIYAYLTHKGKEQYAEISSLIKNGA